MGAWLILRGATEEELDVEFFFEKVGAAFGITQIFGYVAASVDLDGNAGTLERSAQAENALAMRMIEAFGDANEGGEATGNSFVIVVETGIGRVMSGWVGLAVVITNYGGDDVAIPAIQARNIAI
jgi:hypothetical protein